MSEKKSLSLPIVLFRVFYVTLILCLLFLVYAVATRGGGHPPSSYTGWNLKMISSHLERYRKENGTLPPLYSTDDSGLKMHSWRALLLPYLEHDITAKYDYSKPWNDQANMTLSDEMPDIYRGLLAYLKDLPRKQPSYLILIPDSHESAEMPSPFVLVEHPDAGFNWLAPRDITCSEYIAAFHDKKLDWHKEQEWDFQIMHELDGLDFCAGDELISIVKKYNETYLPKTENAKNEEALQSNTP